MPIRRLEVPHPNITLILNLGAPLAVHAPALAPPGERFDSFVAGLFDTPAVTQNTGVARGIELNLSPLGCWRLLGTPMHELANRVVPLDALLGTQALTLVDRLMHLDTWDARFDLLDRALTRRLARSKALPREMDWAWHQLTRSSGALRVSAIATELQWSRRRLGAAFREHVGMTPKAIARVVRFDRAVHKVSTGATCRWSDIAYECGYADQAHLAREFREFAGIAPTEFLRRRQQGMAGIAAD